MANYNLELWSGEFAANLYDASNWYSVMKNWSQYAVGNSVRIPQAAAKSTPLELSSVPVATVGKAFQDLTFNIVNLVAEPRYVDLSQDIANTFDGRAKLSADMLAELKQGTSIRIGYDLQPASASISTSGTTTRTNIYGQAGVKSLTYNDILKARALLAKSGANMNSLYMVVDAIGYNDLLTLPEFNRDTILSDKVLVDGFVGKIGSFNVITRNLGLAYTSLAAKPSTVDYADGYDNTHFSSILCFDASKVGYAYGDTQLGVTPFATGYYTDVMQARTRIGASKLYADGSGIVSIIESV